MALKIDEQQGDVFLFNLDDNGEIIVSGGLVQMTGGFETMAYLCLFGGNLGDDGSEGNLLTWWGNGLETQESRKHISRLQNLIAVLPLITGNLARFEDAAQLDLDSFKAEGIANVVQVTASIPRLNTLQLDIDIHAVGDEKEFTFLVNWQEQQVPEVPEFENISSAVTLGLQGGGSLLLQTGGKIKLG